MKNALTADAPPPGETGKELTGCDAFEVFERGLISLTAPPDLHLEVNQLAIRRFQGKAVVDVGFTDGRSCTLRIAEKRVRDLRDRLNCFLEQGKK